MTTEEKFHAAVNVIRNLPKNGSYQPSNDLMLRFYAYYKQATIGPCDGSRPPFYDLVGRAKYDAWKKLGSLPKADAMTKYVEELHSIVETMSYSDNVANFLEAPTNELEFVNMNDLELVVGDVMERVRSQSNSPLVSREASPIRYPINSDNGNVNIQTMSSYEHSEDDEDIYIDTIEYPENHTDLNHKIEREYADSTKAHMSRSRSKPILAVDISHELMSSIQNLKRDIECLQARMVRLEKKNESKNLFTSYKLSGQQLSVLLLLLSWPILVSVVMNRYFNSKKK